MTEYKPEVGDKVRVEVEVVKVRDDGLLTLTAGGPIAFVALADKVELVRRKPPELKPGDVVQGPYGTWLIGSRCVTYTSATNGGTVDSNHTAETLAQNAALSPQSYTIIKHKENV